MEFMMTSQKLEHGEQLDKRVVTNHWRTLRPRADEFDATL